jgi:hypothetical protein
MIQQRILSSCSLLEEQEEKMKPREKHAESNILLYRSNKANDGYPIS